MNNDELLNVINYNKEEINNKLSASVMLTKTYHAWLENKISNTESKCLYAVQPNTKKNPSFKSNYSSGFQSIFDYNCASGLRKAFNYIIEQKDQYIDIHEITQIHYLICNENNITVNDTFIRPGVIKRETANILLNRLQLAQYEQEKNIYPAFRIHYDIIKLQAFDDYNKRTARMIMNWILIKNGYSPIFFIKENDKTEYQKSLLNNKMGNHEQYIEYMLQTMISSQKDTLNFLSKTTFR
ncbi:MAG: Fic family protein [Alphaproteobacteria bacterium]|nr:Fic family protein [Alphaproteobacteria bacterium]